MRVRARADARVRVRVSVRVAAVLRGRVWVKARVGVRDMVMGRASARVSREFM